MGMCWLEHGERAARKGHMPGAACMEGVSAFVMQDDNSSIASKDLKVFDYLGIDDKTLGACCAGDDGDQPTID
jgi:hypothetical protein